VILTVDLGTSATKVVVWDENGPVGSGRAPLSTSYGPGGRAEQDAGDWWPSVVAACAQARAECVAGGAGPPDVEVIGLSAARQTFVLVSAALAPLGLALVWSDRRASRQAVELAAAWGGAEAIRQRSGIHLDGAAVAAKVAWLAEHERGRLDEARWLLAPRDLVVERLTGRVVTDATLASATGLYDVAGNEVAELVGSAAGKLPEVVAPDTVVGTLTTSAAGELGLQGGVPVVIGAGDRACEALGVAATERRPTVSWGTTANVSRPTPTLPTPAPSGLVHTRSAGGGWLLEGGTSAAGSLLAWLVETTVTSPDALMADAAASPPGARGVVALPWPGGARAPWWRDEAGAAFVGLSLHHGRGDLCRAVVEAVAFEVGRCLRAAGPDATVEALALAGGGGHAPLWVEIVTAVAGVPGVMRRSPEAASAGAALLAGRAVGVELDVDRLNPVTAVHEPDPGLVAGYGALSTSAERAAAAVVDLDLGAAGAAGGTEDAARAGGAVARGAHHARGIEAGDRP
jgi:xylulokinase